MELIRLPERQFRVVEGRTPEVRTYVISVSLALVPHTDAPALGYDSSYLSSSLIGLTVTHEHPLHDSHGDASFDVNELFPCPVQINVCPQSLPTPALQIPVDSDTQERSAIAPAVGISPHSLDAENAYPDRKEDLPPFIMGKQLRPPAPMHKCHC